MRILLSAAEQVAGLHHLMAGLVDRRRLVIDRADQRIAVGHLGHQREVLADLDAGHVGLDRLERAADVVGGVGLEVPGVELAGPPTRNSRMQLMSLLLPTAPALSRSASVRPTAPALIDPALRKSRRDNPPQTFAPCFVWNSSMVVPLEWLHFPSGSS